jgi:type II secretory pathway component PulJ
MWAGMKTVLEVLVAIMMLATLGVLFAGMFGLVRSDHDPARSNRLMRWRVILQAATLILFVILLSLLRS